MERTADATTYHCRERFAGVHEGQFACTVGIGFAEGVDEDLGHVMHDQSGPSETEHTQVCRNDSTTHGPLPDSAERERLLPTEALAARQIFGLVHIKALTRTSSFSARRLATASCSCQSCGHGFHHFLHFCGTPLGPQLNLQFRNLGAHITHVLSLSAQRTAKPVPVTLQSLLSRCRLFSLSSGLVSSLHHSLWALPGCPGEPRRSPLLASKFQSKTLAHGPRPYFILVLPHSIEYLSGRHRGCFLHSQDFVKFSFYP